MSAQNIQEFSLLEINTPKLMTGKISNLKASTGVGREEGRKQPFHLVLSIRYF